MTYDHFRAEVRDSDPGKVERLAATSGFFRPDEVTVARELVEERLEKGEPSGYNFFFSDVAPDILAGYACFGPTPCTIGSFDLYWIVVNGECQGKGLGRQLMNAAEKTAKGKGGKRMYVETSGKDQYHPTRLFYLRCGYAEVARLTDFYDIGDDKVIFQKNL